MRNFAERARRAVDLVVMVRVIAPLLVVSTVACAGDTDVGLTDRDGPPTDRPTPGGALEARIVSPNGSASALAGRPLELAAEFTFAGSPVIPEVVEWRSSLKGTLGTGNPLDGVVLTPGEHEISVEAVFEGDRAIATTELEVGDLSVRIETPSNGATVTLGEALRFEGRAERWNGGQLETLVDENPGAGEALAEFRWSLEDDDDRELATTRSFETRELGPGLREVTLEVALDESDLEASATVTLNVVPADAGPPEATIVSPECGGVWTNDRDIELIGQVSAGASATWREAITGRLGSGERFSFGDGAEPGKHRIDLTATDGLGRTATATCDLTFIESDGTLADLYPDSSALNPSGLEVTALSAGPPIVAGRESGLTVFFEGGEVSHYATSEVGFAANVEVRAVATEGDVVHIGTELGSSRCTLDATALTACAVIDATPVLDLTLLASDSSIVVTLSPSTVRLEKLDDSAVEIPSSQLSLNGPRLVASVDSGVLVATATGICEIAEVPELLDDTEEALCEPRFSLAGVPLAGASVRTLTVDPPTIWLGTTVGAVRWQRESGSVLVLTTPPLEGANVLASALGRDTALWLGTDRGLLRYDRERATMVELRGADWGGGSDRVQALTLSDDGSLVIGTDEGLYLYRGP